MNFGKMSKRAKPKICFFNSEAKSILKNKAYLADFIEVLFKKEKRELNYLHYIFCSDNELLKINKKFLKHDFYTDVITFNYSKLKKPIEGEVYISINCVKENSKIYKTLYSIELHRVLFHGALHLCGFRDKTLKEINLMRKKEDFLLRAYFD